MTVMELVKRYLQTKIGMKPSTRMNYNFVTNILVIMLLFIMQLNSASP